jgi:hypothetical protein
LKASYFIFLLSVIVWAKGKNKLKEDQEMSDLTSELNEYQLPIKINWDSEYYEILSNKLNDYLQEMRKTKGIDSNTLKETEENIKLIKESIICYFDADISSAKTKVMHILKKYENNPFIISNIDESYAFRGMSKLTGIQMQGYDEIYGLNDQLPLSFFKARIGRQRFGKEEFLHIPFSKRGNVSTQRFSIAGVPCMYFGISSYVCWLELGRPADGEFNVASYKLPKSLGILNLAITQHLINGISNSEFSKSPEVALAYCKSMIEVLPLIIATSFQVREQNRVFRTEYIVSQLIMQCLKEINVDGVAYISKQVSDDTLGYTHAVNLAIPMKNNIGKEYSELAYEIKFSEPVNLAEFLKLSRVPNFRESAYVNHYEDFNGKVEMVGEMVEYTNTIFSKFDDFLVNKLHKNLQ